MIVDSALYRRGQRVPVDHGGNLSRLRAAATEPHDFVWVGLVDPSPEALHDVAGVFGLHRLAVEDALSEHQRPKLEHYGDCLFLVLRTLWYVDALDAVETGEISLFVGDDYVVTVRHGEGFDLHGSRLALEEHPLILDKGPAAVVHAVCDRVVDSYADVAKELETDVDEIEASVFSAGRTDSTARIYALKREVGEMRRAVLPLREPMRLFAEGHVPGMHPGARPFFADIGNHLAHTAESIDTLDSLLASAFQAHLTRISVQQNEDMRRISAGVALAAVPTLIAGVYGMNFTYMPELEWHLGYPYAIALMIVIVGALWVFFKKSGWL